MPQSEPEHKSMLCVGGPSAGKRYATLFGNGFIVPEMRDGPMNDPLHEEYQPNKPPAPHFTRYRREVFRTNEGDVSFWVPEGQTQLQTITLLLETYERATEKLNAKG